MRPRDDGRQRRRREQRVERARVGGGDSRRRGRQADAATAASRRSAPRRRRRRTARAAPRAGRRRRRAPSRRRAAARASDTPARSPACFHSPSRSHSRWPPSTAANIAPTAPMPRPATRSIRTPASCSARSTPAWYAPAVPVPVSTSAVRSRVEYGRSGESEVITRNEPVG